ncbi:MAG TPA: 4-(cytidine 5'-diphospho)-2-C-methyl-D-erythritol kinase [Candidatus Nanoarchaeia archaeon]|nr:4-(cytidine 5'-diphospho)-2-C-methyl-D-erythritol kinase [Candidatus Nanoarchaeia archaeon]
MLLKSHAKINLTLKIGRKAKGGLHQIESVMHPIDLFDNLAFEKIELDDVQIESNNHSILNKDNLAYKAAMLLKKRFGVHSGIKIRIEKNIPLGAGLGGGSSNAAATLIALNSMWKLRLDHKKLMALGFELGSDIPFFIPAKPALVEGVGDKVKPITIYPKINAVIINPGFQVSTKWAYDAYDRNRKKSPKRKALSARNYSKLVSKKDIDGMADNLHNDFTEVVGKKYKVVKEMIALLNKYGALNSCMSGSGPTVYGLYSSIYTAREAYFKLKDIYPFVYLTKTV